METKNIYSPQPNSPMSIGVLLSGSGPNFEALFRRQAELSQEGSDDARIEIVFSNVPDCRGVRIARELGINTAALSSKYFFERLGRPPDDEESRDLYDREVIAGPAIL